MNTDKLTTILGAGMAALTAAEPVINMAGGTMAKVDLIQLAIAVVMAVFGYFTNKEKNKNGLQG